MTVPSREIAQRELRNRITEVLREVEHGVALRVTVRGRPVADLVPVESERHRRFVPRSTVERLLAECPPDAGFVADVDEALGQRRPPCTTLTSTRATGTSTACPE